MSKWLRLNSSDILKGFVISLIAAFLTSLHSIISTGTYPTQVEWNNIVMVTLSAGIAYLIKNLFTNSSNQLGQKEPLDV